MHILYVVVRTAGTESFIEGTFADPAEATRFGAEAKANEVPIDGKLSKWSVDQYLYSSRKPL